MAWANFVEFRVRGHSDIQSGQTTSLGAAVRGSPINAMQLRYRLDRSYSPDDVQWRRRLDEIAWESTTHDPERGPWRPVYRRGLAEDHPPYGAGMDHLPDLYDVDTPGLPPLLRRQRQLSFSAATLLDGRSQPASDNALTSPDARDIVWTMNFVQWIEVHTAGAWQRASKSFLWTSTLRLSWREGEWRPGPWCSIGAGHQALLSPPSLGLMHPIGPRSE